MRNISKAKREPKSLVALRATPGADFDGRGKNVAEDLKASLLREQGCLCCYCMRRIPDHRGRLKVEHWHAQSVHPNERLVYSNLLAACPGQEGESPARQSCDTRKGDSELRYNPANLSHDVESKVVYSGIGYISAPNDPIFDNQLNEVLNLNLDVLRFQREEVIEGVFETLTSMKDKSGRLSKKDVSRELHRWERPRDSNQLKEYSGVVVYLLRRKLERWR